MADVVYIAGKMRGLIDMGREHFHQAEVFLKNMGYTVINPARLQKDLKPESYMPICLAMLREADAVAMLPDWRDSVGAQMEYQYATETGKRMIHLKEDFGFDYEDELAINSDERLMEEVLKLTKDIVEEQLEEYLAKPLVNDLMEGISEGISDNEHLYMKHLRDWRDGAK